MVAACDEEMREAAGSNGSMGTTTKGHRHEEEARLDCSGSRAAKYEVVGVGLGTQQGRRLLLGEEVEAGGAGVDLSHGEGGRWAWSKGRQWCWPWRQRTGTAGRDDAAEEALGR